MDDCQDTKQTPWKGYWKERLKKVSLLDYWAMLVFLIAVLQLFAIRGKPTVFLLFLLPPVLAYIFKEKAESKSTKIVCASFLSLIALGLAIGSCAALLPRMPSFEERLPRAHGRMLTWYVWIYLLFLTTVFPLHVSILNLVKHRRRLEPELSRFTCWLLLIVALLIGPWFIAVAVETFKLWPIVE
jgi:hypothetical protein